MSTPTSEDAIRAWVASETLGLTSVKGKDGLWRAQTIAGHTLVAAGIHSSPHEAVLAGETVLGARTSVRRATRCLAAIDSLQAAPYFPRPRDIPNPSPGPGEPATIRVWDIIKVGGAVSTVTGRTLVLIALEDAESARLAGTL